MTPTAAVSARPPRRDPLRPDALARAMSAEWTKLRSVRSTAWTLAVTVVALVGLAAAISYAVASRWSQLDVRDRLLFDPTRASLSGTFLAQLAVGVLGVLLITAEYGTGEIHVTFAAVPQRRTVLGAKAVVLAAVTVVVCVVSAFGAFFAGQAVLTEVGADTVISAPNVLRAVVGAGLYLTVIALFGLGLGALTRSTAGGIAVLVFFILIAPIIVAFLPSYWQTAIAPYLPSAAGQALFSVQPLPDALSPWQGFGVVVGYAAAALAAAAVVITRRDA